MWGSLTRIHNQCGHPPCLTSSAGRACPAARAQTTDALTIINQTLEAAGSSLEQALKVQVVLVEPEANWAAMKDACARRHSGARLCSTLWPLRDPQGSLVNGGWCRYNTCRRQSYDVNESSGRPSSSRVP